MVMERRHFVRSKWFLKDGIKNFFHAKKKHRKNKITIPAFYFGVWMFTDEISKRSHRLEVADNLEIFIDGKRLPGKIVSLDNRKLLFLDNYGYHLRIDAVNQLPVSVYDEADDRVYPLEKLN
ncbi:DUF4828 domain-containing protein [Ligilactobacillus salivarius]|mgnify:FL=1|uniref:DUF4828 domain-containing protein n=1 Tax=Ligilactobacillus salivarius TaxID=1624 RepID=UPI003BB02EDD